MPSRHAGRANASVHQQRAKILVPTIAQGLTRRPAASDASVLHVQGAPVFASSDGRHGGRHGTQHCAPNGAVHQRLAAGNALTARNSSLRHTAREVSGAGAGAQRQRQHFLAALIVAYQRRASAAPAVVDFRSRFEKGSTVSGSRSGQQSADCRDGQGTNEGRR